MKAFSHCLICPGPNSGTLDLRAAFFVSAKIWYCSSSFWMANIWHLEPLGQPDPPKKPYFHQISNHLVVLHFLAISIFFAYLQKWKIDILHIITVIVCLQGYWIPPSWLLCLESVSHLLVMISSSTNFLIYCTISTKFKIFLKRTFLYR